MAKDINLQDVFLNQARKDRIPVTIYITNGFQFKGVVKGFDNYTVILDTDGKQNLIYKHAISTITPLKRFFSAEIRVQLLAAYSLSRSGAVGLFETAARLLLQSVFQHYVNTAVYPLMEQLPRLKIQGQQNELIRRRRVP